MKVKCIEKDRQFCKMKLTKIVFKFFCVNAKVHKRYFVIYYYKCWYSLLIELLSFLNVYWNFYCKSIRSLFYIRFYFLDCKFLTKKGNKFSFEYYINANYSDIARITLSEDWVRVLIISVVVSVAYSLLSKLLK